MNARPALLLALLWMLARPMSAEETGTINGQVFIVTKGAENVKLALVHVGAIPEKTFAEFVAKKREAADLLRGPLDKIIEETRVAKEKSYKAYSEAGASNVKWSKAWEAAVERYLSALARQVYLNSETYLFEDFPPHRAEAVTDADGKFTLPLPPGRYRICAKSSRLVGKQREYYFWHQNVTIEPGKAVQLLLSNENLTGDTDSERRVTESMIGGVDSIPAFIEKISRELDRADAEAANQARQIEEMRRKDEETQRKAIEEKIKRRIENHARATAKLKSDWRIPAMRFSKLGEVDDEFTICRELNDGLWESRGVAQSVPRAGENPERFPWVMVYRIHSDGSLFPVYSQFGNRQTGDASFIPH